MAVAERLLNLQPLADTRPDSALVYEAQRGNPQAASILIERYYPRVSSFVAHLTYGRGNIEDLTQEVFTRALKALGRFNGQYQFEHWLLRIAKNLCIDEARRNVRSPELTDPGELTELKGISAPDYVWESISRELVASVVHRALAALPSRQRAILVMREMEGMSYADIAQVVGTNPRGVEATLRRARARFRMEIARAESAEAATAACRRVIRLMADDGQASHSAEVAGHLAICGDCRRRTRASGSVTTLQRTFGFFPSLLGPAGIAHGLLHRSGVHTGPAFRRASGRLRDWASLAALGTGAAAAVPFSRMAEVAGGVFVATAVTLAPALPAFQPAVTTAAPVAYAPAQVTTVAPVTILYHASPSGPLTSAPGTPIVQSTSLSPPAPSLVASAGPDSTTPDILGALGLGSSQNVVTTTLGNVASMTSILSSQLEQVSHLTNSTVSGPSGGLVVPELIKPLPVAATGLVNSVAATLNGLTGGALKSGGHPSSATLPAPGPASGN